jgi:transcriptional regulator with XRE-family HTH domain
MLDINLSELADALGLSFQQVQKYEKSTNRISASRLQQISSILQAPIPFFFEGAPGGAETTADDEEVSAESPQYINDFMATTAGLNLAKSFSRIQNRKLRTAIVQLVEQIGSGKARISEGNAALGFGQCPMTSMSQCPRGSHPSAR